jgi:hypothetical protein
MEQDGAATPAVSCMRGGCAAAPLPLLRQVQTEVCPGGGRRSVERTGPGELPLLPCFSIELSPLVVALVLRVVALT